MKSDNKSDPLAAFRRNKPAGPESAKPAPAESETYVAFAAKDRVERLRIRRPLDPVRSPRYLLLHDIAYDPFGLTFALFFEHMIVTVRGKNLQLVVAALESSTAEYIEQYHPDLWPKPADDAAPFIETIEVFIKGDKPVSPPAKPDEKKH